MKGLILIAEDDPQNRKLFKEFLERDGYQILLAENGEEAVRAALEHKPDLILMDIQMPVMDGLEATWRIKGNDKTQNIPIIAITSYAMIGDEDEILAAGCDGYLAKPVSLWELLNTIKTFLAT